LANVRTVCASGPAYEFAVSVTDNVFLAAFLAPEAVTGEIAALWSSLPGLSGKVLGFIRSLGTKTVAEFTATIVSPLAASLAARARSDPADRSQTERDHFVTSASGIATPLKAQLDRMGVLAGNPQMIDQFAFRFALYPILKDLKTASAISDLQNLAPLA
jgi:hypothetical protein